MHERATFTAIVEGERRSLVERTRALAEPAYHLPQIANRCAAHQQRAEVVVPACSENLPVRAMHRCDLHQLRMPFSRPTGMVWLDPKSSPALPPVRG
jgi:hypothetical protein